MLAPATIAPTAVEQFRDSQHHEVLSGHGINISGELATFTFDVTWHVHAVDNGTTFQAAYSESFKYTLVRPAIYSSWATRPPRARGIAPDEMQAHAASRSCSPPLLHP